MDADRFDRLAKTLGLATTRRGVLVALLGGVVGETSAAARRRRKKKKKKCAKAGQRPNKRRKKCCSGLVRDGGGVCVPRCTPATCVGNSLCIGGVCQPCDVCESGCFFSTLQAAVDAAAPGETIHICAGIYTGDIAINQSVRLIGAGDGLGAGNTILDGTGTGPVIAISPGRTVALQDLRVTGGGANGGGINNNSATLTMTDCTVTGNTASDAGGGIFNNGGTVVLESCAVTGNSAGHCGGGIYNQDSVSGAATTTLNGSSVTDNSAGDANCGGGIFNEPTNTVNLVNSSTVDDNFADGVENNCAGLGTYNGSGCA